MRVNIYAEEMTGGVEIVEKTIEGTVYSGVQFYLESSGPLLHLPGEDDLSAVTFWGKKDLLAVMRKALQLLDQHERERATRKRSGGTRRSRTTQGG